MNEKSPGSLSLDYETLSLVELLGSEEVPGFQKQLAKNPDDLMVRGTLHRAGRAGFYHWLEQHREMLGWDEPAFRFTAVRQKIAIGLGKICEVIVTEKGVPVQLVDLTDRWAIEVSSPQRGGIHHADYLAGFVQEFGSWAGLGKFYRVKVVANETGGRESYRVVLFKAPIDD